jgi:hypothetical protein
MSDSQPFLPGLLGEGEVAVAIAAILALLEAYRRDGLVVVYVDSMEAHQALIRGRNPDSNPCCDMCVLIAWDVPEWARREIDELGVMSWTISELVSLACIELERSRAKVPAIPRSTPRPLPLVHHTREEIAEFIRRLQERS